MRRCMDRKSNGELIASGDKPLWSSQLERIPVEENVVSFSDIHLPDNLAPGPYVLRLSDSHGRAKECLRTIVVTDCALTIVSAGTSTAVFACDISTGAPLADVEVLLRYWEDSDNRDTGEENTLTARTNAEGIARFSLKISDNQEKRADMYAFTRGKHPALAFSNYSGWEPQTTVPSRRVAAILCDRPLYRPGETVHWKAVIRDNTGGHIVNPKGVRALKVEVRNEKGTFREDTCTPDSFGCISGNFILPLEAPLGRYGFEIGDEEDDLNGYGFRVEEYRAPESVGEIVFTHKPEFMGDVATGTVKARYYSGEPIQGAKVKLSIAPLASDIGRGDFFGAPIGDDDEEEGRVRYGSLAPAQKLELTTNEAGEAEFSFTTGIFEACDAEYSINAELTDPSERTCKSSATLFLPRNPVHVAMLPEHVLIPEGETVVLGLAAFKGRDEATGVDGTLTPARIIGFDERTHKAQTKPLDPLPVRISATGTTKLKIPGLTPGEYEFRFASDLSGPVRFSTTVIVGMPSELFGESATSLHFDSDRIKDLDVSKLISLSGEALDAAVFCRPDDHVRVFVPRLPGVQNALLATSDWTLRDVKVLAPSQGAQIVDLTLASDSFGNFHILCAYCKDGQSFQMGSRLAVRPEKMPLSIKVNAAQSTVLPGKRQKVTLSVHRADGRKTGRVPVVLTAYDESLEFLDGNFRSLTLDTFGFGYYDDASFRLFLRSPDLSRISQITAGMETEFQSLRRRIQNGDDEIYLMSPFEVSGEPACGYACTETLAGTRMKTDLRDVASSVSVVNRKFLEDTGATDAQGLLLRTTNTDLGGLPGNSGGSYKPVQLRRNLAKLAFWSDTEMTDKNGDLSVEFAVPEGLTSWRVVAYVTGSDDCLGSAETSFTSSVPVSGRIAAPRFLVEGDDAELSLVAGNNGKEALPIRLNFAATSPEGKAQTLLTGAREAVENVVAAGANTRADWRFHAEGHGSVLLQGSAESSAYSDGVVQPLEIAEHGFATLVARAGHIEGTSAKLELDLPEHRAGSASLSIDADIGLAPAMLRALPYLVRYPYNCSEQTTSRVVPLALLMHRLTGEGWSKDAVLAAAGLRDEGEYNKLLSDAREKFESTYSSEGGWGWFDGNYLDDYMTAYVLWGQGILRGENIELVDKSRTQRAYEHLSQRLVQKDLYSADRAWILFSLTSFLDEGKAPSGRLPSGDLSDAMHFLAGKTSELDSSALAMTAMSALALGDRDTAKELCAKLEARATLATEPGTGIQTAVWGRADGYYFCFYNHPAESTAWALMAIARIDPSSPLVESSVNWLVRERQSGRWESTRTTCISLMALEEARRLEKRGASGELAVVVNGVSQPKPSSATGRSFSFTLGEDKLREGANSVEIHTSDGLPVYYEAALGYFDKRPSLPASASGISVERRYYRVVATPTLAAGPRYSFAPLADGASVKADEEVEVRLTFRTAEDMEYLMLEDAKPAGFELLEASSGYGNPAQELEPAATPDAPAYTGRMTWVYVEPRDRSRTAFLSLLPQGTWELRYRIRAESAGLFHALPAKIQALYTPRTNGNSAENILGIQR